MSTTSVLNTIRDWHSGVDRDMPWKQTTDPYRIWLSEIMLQQTQVAQVKGYYRRFLSLFPDVKTLATANESEVLKAWEGLGYYRRAKYVHSAAKQIMDDFNGRFPDNYTDVLKLKGVGHYTAGAIMSFAYHQPVLAIDTNVERLMARLYRIDSPKSTPAMKNAVESLLQAHIEHLAPAKFNQMLIDFGALVCDAKRPRCEECPISEHCQAYKDGVQAAYPVTKAKKPRRKRYFHFVIERTNGNIAIYQRDDTDIWSGMYQFRLIELDSPKNLDEHSIKSYLCGLTCDKVSRLYEGKQLLTHQEIYCKFWIAEVANVNLRGAIVVDEESVENYAFPGIIRQFWKQCKSQVFD